MQQKRTLSQYITFSFIAIVLLTALAAWIPEVLLIRNRLEEATWARVEQGRRAARALYGSVETEVAGAAILAAQLPTLREPLARGEREALPEALETVETSLGLNTMLVCSPEGEIVARFGAEMPAEVCAGPETAHVEVLDDAAGGAEAWMLAARPIRSEGTLLGAVVTGLRLDDAFTAQLQAETGLEHTLLLDETPLATSFAGGPAYWTAVEGRQAETVEAAGDRGWIFRRDGIPYYALRLRVGESALVDEVALPAGEFALAQRQLLQTQLVSLIVVIIGGTALVIFSARRIGAPLRRLSQAAARFGRGDLAAPITVESGVQEVDVMAAALEQARVELQRAVGTLQEEKAWVEHLLEAIEEGVVTLDDDRRITFFSEGAERLTGWQEGEVLGRHCDSIFRPAEEIAPFSDLIPRAGARRKVWLRLPGGQSAAFSITRADLAPPGVAEASMALVFRDISEEEAVEHLLGHFLANVTHEFRTPITALGASVELLLDQSGELAPDELEQMLTWLHLSILSLQTLVDNLLEASSLEARRFRVNPRPTDLGEIIGEAARLMQPLLEKYNQYLDLELPPRIPVVYADARRVVQVLVNLLSNAHKYGPEESAIEIRAVPVGDEVRVSVSDRGPGIPEEIRGTIFQRFSHFGPGHDDSRQYGVGLGWGVVKAIVEAHGGETGVEEAPSGGASFWFTLPLAERARSASARPAHARPESARPREAQVEER